MVGDQGRARFGGVFGGRARRVDGARRSLEQLGEEWEEGGERSKRGGDGSELVRKVLRSDSNISFFAERASEREERT